MSNRQINGVFEEMVEIKMVGSEEERVEMSENATLIEKGDRWVIRFTHSDLKITCVYTITSNQVKITRFQTPSQVMLFQDGKKGVITSNGLSLDTRVSSFNRLKEGRNYLVQFCYQLLHDGKHISEHQVKLQFLPELL